LRIQYCLSIFLLGSALVPSAWAKDLALVANKSTQSGALTMTDLAKICKAETKRWPDSKPVTFVTRDPASPDMKLVVEKVYEMTPEAVGSLISTVNHGRTNRPAIVVVDSDQEIVRRVEATPGAIGIVDVYSITGGVAVVKIGGKLPLEPGYPLHGN